MTQSPNSDSLDSVLHALEESNRLQQENADNLTRLERQRDEDAASIVRDRKRAAVVRHLVLTIVGVIFLLLCTVAALIVVATKQHDLTSSLDCRAKRSVKFYDAEVLKVRGQVEAWHQQLDGLNGQAVALRKLLTDQSPNAVVAELESYNRSLAESAAGLSRSISKSEAYLTTVDAIRNSC